VFKQMTVVTLLLMLASSSIFAATTIEKSHPCAMKNLDVICANGESVKLDVISTTDSRGEVFLNIKAPKGNVGNYLLLYINDNKKPEVLRVEKGTDTVNVSKGAFISRNVILKLRNANSVHFEIAMQKSNPLSGSLGQNHFDWLKRFGNACY